MQRFYFTITYIDQWYDIMRECRQWFGVNWRSQPKSRRRLSERGNRGFPLPRQIWFDVPDERFATWIAVKMALEVVSESRMQANK
jgi:hypothetical protein